VYPPSEAELADAYQLNVEIARKTRSFERMVAEG
jgi:hypothetical protein